MLVSVVHTPNLVIGDAPVTQPLGLTISFSLGLDRAFD
jgi:hypothetical protein